MPRFVLLEHDHPRLHYDLMLEAGEVLWTWRLDRIPGAGEVTGAERTFDHRLLYLDYEGPISGGRGAVRRVDGGTYEWLAQGAGHLAAFLEGALLRGELRLERCGDAWEASYRPG